MSVAVANGGLPGGESVSSARGRGSKWGVGRILLVEDHEDVRRLLALTLELEGYEVTEAETAEQGLARLRTARYALVLSDYALPGHTGAWLLHQAAAEGLLRTTPALVLTAHPTPEGVDDYDVVRKPLDYERFLTQVHKLVHTSPSEDGAMTDPGVDRRIELVLYISSRSPRSHAAVANVRRMLQGLPQDGVALTICDLSTDPGAGERDQIVFTPTLVRRSPDPRVWIVGDIQDAAIVRGMLGLPDGA